MSVCVDRYIDGQKNAHWISDRIVALLSVYVCVCVHLLCLCVCIYIWLDGYVNVYNDVAVWVWKNNSVCRCMNGYLTSCICEWMVAKSFMRAIVCLCMLSCCHACFHL